MLLISITQSLRNRHAKCDCFGHRKNCLPRIPFFSPCLSFFGAKGKQESTAYAGTSDLWHHTIVPYLPVQWKKCTLTHRSLPKDGGACLLTCPECGYTRWLTRIKYSYVRASRLRWLVTQPQGRYLGQGSNIFFKHTLSHTAHDRFLVKALAPLNRKEAVGYHTLMTWAPNRTAETFTTPRL